MIHEARWNGIFTLFFFFLLKKTTSALQINYMEFLSPNPSYTPKLPKNDIEKASHNIIFEIIFFNGFLKPRFENSKVSR